MTTRCVSDNNQYYKDNIINSNRTTTRSWPVICHQPKPYDEDDCETVFALNNNHTSNEDLTSCQKFFGSDAQEIESENDTQLQNKMQSRPSQTTLGVSACATRPVVFMLITLMMTLSATAMLCAAVMTDHWENIRWDRNVIEAKINNTSIDKLHWYFNGRVAKISKFYYRIISN